MSILRSGSLAIVLTLGVWAGPASADIKKPPIVAGSGISTTGVVVAGGFLTLAIAGLGVRIFRSRHQSMNSNG